MSDEERTLFVQRALIGNGYLGGHASGSVDSDTRSAIARYQTEENLVVNGRVGFELYASLLGSDRPLAAGPPKSYFKGDSPDPVADAVPTRVPVALAIDTERGTEPEYAPLEEFRMAVRVSRSAFVYCYYQDAGGAVARIFPNRFQPEPYTPGGDRVEIPSRNAAFQISFETAGSTEEVACLASDREVGLHLPRELKTRDLAPLPVSSIDELVDVFEEIDRGGLQVARLPITVSTTY
jgi:peptidoglycan hydrolase-like protein with peptidoglycan-binding domain